MIPLKSWIEKLILRCAKKDEVNQFTKEQRIEKKVNVVNSDVSTNSVPTPNTTGVLGSVDFKDARDALIAALEAYRTPMEGKGIRLRINDNYLGFRVSDEGIPTSYVNHPYPDGPANQIATMKYVSDWGNAINHYLDIIHELLDQTRADIQTIRESVALLDMLRHIDDIPTEGSNNLVRSGGIYSFVVDRLGAGLNNLRAEFGAGLNDLKTELLNSIGGANSQVGQAFKVGMIRSCFCIYGGNILPGDLINGSWLIYGNHRFQVEDDDKQWSLCSYFGEHRSFCELRQAMSNGWTLPSNTTWVALMPCHGYDYADTHGLFMCIEVR